MLNAALFALGLLGIKTGKTYSQKQQQEDYCRKIELREQERDQLLHKAYIQQARMNVIKMMQDEFYLCRTKPGRDFSPRLFYYDDINMYNRVYRGKYDVAFADFEDIPIWVAQRVGMSVPEFLVWIENLAHSWDAKCFKLGANLYLMDGKYCTRTFAQERGTRFFEGKKTLFVEILPNDIIREYCNQDIHKYSYLLEEPYHIVDIGCPVDQFMQEHPKELLTDLFNNEDWKGYV